MPSNTPNIGLFKKDPIADGADTFNIDTMLNENWDKIDTAVGTTVIAARSALAANADWNTVATPGMYLVGDTTAMANHPSIGNNLLLVVFYTNGYVIQRASSVTGAAVSYRCRWDTLQWQPWFKEWNSGNDGAGSGLDADLFDGAESALFARLASPTFNGTPAAPTPAQGTNTTQIATTAFVNTEIAADTAGLAPKASPAFTGTPTAPTAATETNTTQIATTAFVRAAGPMQTTAAITLYVDAVSGNDANTGTAAGVGNALKTILAAINKIPQIVNHAVTINVAPGTYTESIQLYGFSGKGRLIILGDTVISTSRSVINLLIEDCTCKVEVKGFNFTTTTAYGASVFGSQRVNLDRLNIIGASGTFSGLLSESSKVYIGGSTISNRVVGILANMLGEVISDVNTGTGNSTALSATYGGVIAKAGAQPSGTLPESFQYGGVIR